MKRFIFLLLTFLISVGVKAQKPYALSNIPSELIKGADVVVRNYTVNFEVHGTDKTTKQVTKALTILNENAKDEAHVIIPYDKLNSVKKLMITLYDRNGKVIRKIKDRDIQDYSATSGFNFFGDSRVKVAEIRHNQYPFTVEYSVAFESEQTLFYPAIFFVNDTKQSLQNAFVTITTPKGLPLRHQLINLEAEMQKIESEERMTYKWYVSNIHPIKEEPYGPNPTEFVPYLLTGPVHFEMEEYKGSMDSWNSFGKWINLLNNGRDVLPAHLIQKIKELTDGLPDKESKIAAIYHYLQQNTRYVSIQLGIGGFQPFEASFVAEKGYGDCKALTNFTKSMLDAAGIDSYYTLVNAGSGARQIQEDFPSSQFNHVFLCVPNGQDTLWLECTSQTNPYGYLGNFTSDRKVLLIDEQGGHLIHTPAYSAEQSTQFRTATVNLLPSGNAAIQVSTHYKGLQYDNVRSLLQKTSMEDQKEALYKRMDIPAIEILDFNLTEEKKPLPEACLEMKVEVRNLASNTGTRLFIKPNVFNQTTNVPKFTSKRKTDIVLGYSYYDTDTVQITLPEGYEVESLPSSEKLSSPFGEYEVQITAKDNQVTYIRSLKVSKGRFPAEVYNDFRKFRKQLKRLDEMEVVLAQKEQEIVPTAGTK